MTEEKRRVGRRTDAEMEALTPRTRSVVRLELPIRDIQWHEDGTATVMLDEPVPLEIGQFVDFVGPVRTGVVTQLAGPAVMVLVRDDPNGESAAQATHLIRPNQRAIGVGV